LSVPAMGFTSADHFQPGSNVICAAVDPASWTTSERPCSKERVSSGLSNVLLAKLPILPPFFGSPQSTASKLAGQPEARLRTRRRIRELTLFISSPRDASASDVALIDALTYFQSMSSYLARATAKAERNSMPSRRLIVAWRRRS